MTGSAYSYKALDRNGGAVSGEVTASSERGAYEQLSARGLSPFEIRPKTRSIRIETAQKRRISKKDLVRYVRQLATLLSANVSILETMTTLSQSAAHPALAARTTLIKKDLRAGRTLSTALQAHLPELPVYVFRLAELGEATGALSRAFGDAADRMEYEATMASEVRQALAYPVFLTVVGTAIVTLMFIFVVPRFAALLGENISQAPWLSRQTIGLGLWLQANWALAAALAAGGAVGVLACFRNQALRQSSISVLESAPVIGPFIKQADVGGWARTVGVALLNKAKLIDALKLGEAGVQSPRFRQNLEIVRRDVRAGRPLEQALAEACPDMDPVVIDLIRTGRSAGALGEMISFAADIFEKDTKEKAKQLTSLTEPMAILAISLIVGVIVLSIVMAMTSLYQFDL